jgi:hypothetical protein
MPVEWKSRSLTGKSRACERTIVARDARSSHRGIFLPGSFRRMIRRRVLKTTGGGRVISSTFVGEIFIPLVDSRRSSARRARVVLTR